MNCPTCNKSVDEYAQFCKYCGSKIDNALENTLRNDRINQPQKKIWETTLSKIVVVIVVTFILLKYLPGLFTILLFIYGFYTILYLIAMFLKSTQPLAFVIGATIYILVILGYIGMLYVYYLALKFMFEGSFFWGILLFLIGIPILSSIPFLVNALIGIIVVGPGYFLLDDLEKKFKT